MSNSDEQQQQRKKYKIDPDEIGTRIKEQENMKIDAICDMLAEAISNNSDNKYPLTITSDKISDCDYFELTNVKNRFLNTYNHGKKYEFFFTDKTSLNEDMLVIDIRQYANE